MTCVHSSADSGNARASAPLPLEEDGHKLPRAPKRPYSPSRLDVENLGSSSMKIYRGLR